MRLLHMNPSTGRAKGYAVNLSLKKKELKDLEMALTTEIEEMEDELNFPNDLTDVSLTDLQRLMTLREKIRGSLTSISRKR